MISERLEYLEDFINSLYLEEEVYKYYKYLFKQIQYDEEIDILYQQLDQYRIKDPINFGFNYSSKDIIKKIRKIVNE